MMPQQPVQPAASKAPGSFMKEGASRIDRHKKLQEQQQRQISPVGSMQFIPGGMAPMGMSTPSMGNPSMGMSMAPPQMMMPSPMMSGMMTPQTPPPGMFVPVSPRAAPPPPPINSLEQPNTDNNDADPNIDI